ncbi:MULTISPECIES: hypothetical protein [unclassified Streptomyces]|uniref:hypothetical protein n=1 Tax=unclassified Streptomyces TaxID=2593676 RepID=UPI0034063DC9
MAIARDLDGWLVLPFERVVALANMIQLREEAVEAGRLPYRRDWPLPQCPECHGSVTKWLSSRGDDSRRRFHFWPCDHGIVADAPQWFRS